MWNINVKKQMINYKLQGSVATYLRYGGVVNQIKQGLLLSQWKKLKSVNFWQSYKQERGCLMHFVYLANALLKDEESLKIGPLTCILYCRLILFFDF